MGVALLCLVANAEAVGIYKSCSCSSSYDLGIKDSRLDDRHSPPEIPDFLEDHELLDADLEEQGEPQGPVLLVNVHDFLRRQVDDSMSNTNEPGQAPIRLVMFGYADDPIGRRDSELQDLSEDAIQFAVRNAWAEFAGPFELYHVEPQPERLRGEGWITLVKIARTLHPAHRGQVFVLKEILTFRHTSAFSEPLRNMRPTIFPIDQC